MRDASHKLGLSLCWGPGGRSIAAPGWAEGQAEQAHHWDACAALELSGCILPHPGHAQSVIRVAGTSRIVTKSQPASHLDQPAALTGILQLHSPYKFLLVLCFLYFAFLNFIFPKGCCGFAACINPKLASCDPRGAGAGASNSERHRWVAGLMPPLLVWLSPPPARPLDYNVAPDAQCPAVKCPSS